MTRTMETRGFFFIEKMTGMVWFGVPEMKADCSFNQKGSAEFCFKVIQVTLVT